MFCQRHRLGRSRFLKSTQKQLEGSSHAPDYALGHCLHSILASAVRSIFALGIVGTDLLAISVLAGSTAYAIGEGRKWPVGLARKPKEASAFYGVLALSVILGIGLNFTALDPIKALYWHAVVNGVLATPVMIMLMILARRGKVMGSFVVSGWLYWLGWISTFAMVLCTVGMIVTFFV